MKDFNRKNLYFSLCGLNCTLCSMYIGRYCPGCGKGEGNQSCSIARCSLKYNNMEYCFFCFNFPCEKYKGIEEYDSFITHQNQLKDINRFKEIGSDAYNNEQVVKFDFLRKLLDNYNDGKRKTFYCLAINLLSIQKIEAIMKQISDNKKIENLTIREKAEFVVLLFQEEAVKDGVILKLRRKKSNFSK